MQPLDEKIKRLTSSLNNYFIEFPQKFITFEDAWVDLD